MRKHKISSVKLLNMNQKQPNTQLIKKTSHILFKNTKN